MFALRLLVLAVGLAAGFPGPIQAGEAQPVLRNWYKLVLELVRHTPTQTPPVAARSFAYLGVTAYEVVASGNPALRSLAGQVNGLEPLPAREEGAAYDEGVVMDAALSAAVRGFFFNTGPSGQQAISTMDEAMLEQVRVDVPADVFDRSRAYGAAVTAHILKWSEADGGAVIENMGFPYEFNLTDGPAHWVPTSKIVQQQAPLLPNWGNNRPFVMESGADCGLPPPPAYDEAKGSTFWTEANEVYQAVNNLTDEQRAIARFWSDDPMLSPTPPGHWISILMQIIDRDGLDVARSADALARLGMAVSDGFIGCWNAKMEYDLLRPVTYIKRVIDPKWEPILITPPFPEYPSGHSTQSGAAATVLTAIFGEGFAFEDTTHVDEGLPGRPYADFHAAAAEAGISRLYGGIHFRAAIERGLDQGHCIGAKVNALQTLR